MSDSIETEVSFSDLIAVFRASRWTILSVTLIAAAAAAGASRMAPKEYKASVTISPVTNDSANGMGSGLSSLSSQFGGLAALVGGSAQADSKKSESMGALQSELLTELYIRQNNLLPILFSSQWNAATGRWKNDVRLDRIPTLWKGNLFFRNSVRSTVTDTKTGLVTLTITWGDPAIAAEWANGVVALANAYLRDKAIKQSEANIAYLTEQAAKTDVVGVRQVIYTILQNEISKAMIARGNQEYAFKIIDPAFVPERPSSPIPLLWVSVGFGVGLVISLAVVVIRQERTGEFTRALHISKA